MRKALPLVLCAAGLAACSPDASTSDELTVFATTGYLADAVHNLAPDAHVITMVGPGQDPHTYQPSTQDIQAIHDADVVLWNGLHLEAQMTDQLSSLGSKQLAVGDQLPEQMLLPWEDDLHDPHIWNNPKAWTLVVDEVADKLAETDPEHAEDYHSRATDYTNKISEAEQQAHEKLASVDNRVLVTGHDAFNYFGKTFDFEVRATDFVSTEATLSASQLSELADYIVEHKVHTVFLDSQSNPQAITALTEAVKQRGGEVKVSDAELFADTLGAEAPTDTYLGAFNHNIDAIAEGLSA
ncbi:metal ABC transporter substrate-binding protein [Corynebacterium tapiri]|uniref:metal ABC transporter substrate-binding protein n=1 Tax=Corynebacterium tapiri TaxID=1448266 RepID=UPI001FE648C5|nr:zinc ABC transporter substrate-binding protein [Corynebacterium tapiri]